MSFSTLSTTMSIVLMLLLSTNAQETGSGVRSTSSGERSHPLTANFDPSVRKLTPNFVGHNIKTIYNELSKRSSGAEKGEFETTEEFRSRVQRENTAPLSGNLDKNGLFAFTLTNSSGEVFYDADLRMMTVAIVLENVSTTSDKKAMTSQFDLSEEKYEASNAYGAKTMVTRMLDKNHEIAFGNYSNFGKTRYVNSITRKLGYTSDIHARDAILIQIQMEVGIARKVKEHLKALALVRIIEPYTFEDTFYRKPTFNDPKEYFVHYCYLNTELEELWIYDDTTGEVFAKKKSIDLAVMGS